MDSVKILDFLLKFYVLKWWEETTRLESLNIWHARSETLQVKLICLKWIEQMARILDAK